VQSTSSQQIFHTGFFVNYVIGGCATYFSLCETGEALNLRAHSAQASNKATLRRR